jgi:pfkB family carbohydrate kinase
MAEVVVFGVVAADVVLRVQRIPAPGDHINAEALGWRIGGSSANVACGLSTAGHHVRLVGPVGRDPMGDKLLAELGPLASIPLDRISPVSAALAPVVGLNPGAARAALRKAVIAARNGDPS